MMSVDEFLRKSAGSYPDKIALFFEEEKVSYSQLDQEVDNLARGLLDLGLDFQSGVCILLGNCSDFVRSYFAIARAGGRIIPLNPLYKGNEIRHIINDSGATHLITAKELLPVMELIEDDVPSLKKIIVSGAESSGGVISLKDLISNTSAPVRQNISETDIAACLYTSGTTGRPKGALLSHGNLIFDAEASIERVKIAHEDVNLCVLPLFHAFAQMAGMLTPIYCGESTVILPQFSVAAVLKTIAEKKISLFCAVPAIFTGILAAVLKGNNADLSSLRICISGGASLPLEISNTYKERFGISILEGNGPTETSPISYVNPPENNKAGSVGTPLKGVKVKIVDDNDLELPDGELGEICVKGPNVMQGYLNQPEATAIALKDGWFHTGDIGKIDESGYIFIVDRKKDIVIVGGLNVYPREIEECLYRYPGVLEAAVIGVSDKDRGECPEAYVVLKPEVEVSPKEIGIFCHENLASFKCPRSFKIVERLPKNASGKIDKKQMKEARELGLL